MTKEIEGYIVSLGQRENINFSYDPDNKEINLRALPKSIDEARSYSNFWESFLEEFSKEVSELTFSYQENSKIIPLTKAQKLKNYFGANIKSEEIQGEVKEYTAKPILISNEKGLARLISNEAEWRELNSLAKNTKDFFSTYVLTLDPLCYRTRVPLELVTKMKLKGESK